MDIRWRDEGRNGIHVNTSLLYKGDIVVLPSVAQSQTAVNKPSVAFNSSQAVIEQAWLQSDTFPPHKSALWACYTAGDVPFAPFVSNGKSTNKWYLWILLLQSDTMLNLLELCAGTHCPTVTNGCIFNLTTFFWCLQKCVCSTEYRNLASSTKDWHQIPFYSCFLMLWSDSSWIKW